MKNSTLFFKNIGWRNFGLTGFIQENFRSKQPSVNGRKIKPKKAGREGNENVFPEEVNYFL